MFKILDGRNHFYQWDLDRKLIVEDKTINKVYFCNKLGNCSVVRCVYDVNGMRLVDVPNLILQKAFNMYVYGYDNNYTKYDETFEIKARTKPEDYIYTDEELKVWDELEQRIIELETDVEALEENGGAVKSVNGLVGEVVLTADDVGAATKDSVEEVKENITVITNDLYTEKLTTGKNLYNYQTVVPGYISNGVLITHDDWVSTDFIKVDDYKNVICSDSNTGNGKSMFFLNTYDGEKNFIKTDSQHGHIYEVENSVVYIRFALRTNTRIDMVQVEEGTIITSYEPYTEKMIKELNKNWEYIKWYAYGDSLTENNDRTTKHYHDYIADKTGIKVINKGVSGTGYARGKDDNAAFYQRVEEIQTDANVITIFGSGNDLGAGLEIGAATDTGTETVCGCINTTLDNIILKAPTIPIGIIAPTPWQSYNPADNNNNMAKYVEALKTICENRSIPYLDLYHNSNLRPWTEEGRNAAFTKDDGNGVHPDETGHKLIAPRIKAFLETLIL